MSDPDVPEHALTASYADPERARLLDELGRRDRTVARLTEVVERCERATRLLLNGATANQRGGADVAARLRAKAEGVELALSYVHDALRVARVHVALDADIKALNAERGSG